VKPTWIRTLIPGLLLGFTVGRLGFADFNELHRMLVFRDLRLLLAFAAAVSLTMALFALFRGRLGLAPVRFHKGTILGAALFGIGWAVTGVCPGVALIQIGQGIWPAFTTLAGIFTGIWIHSRLQKQFGAPVSGC
jgi:uncharacterized membrane protein YedE/YeeE